MAKRKRPNKRKRAAIARQKANAIGNASPSKLIAQYEREIKSTALSSEVERLTNEIARLKMLIEHGNKKLKVKTILADKPNIGTSLNKKKSKMRSWVSVYQGGSTGLKK